MKTYAPESIAWLYAPATGDGAPLVWMARRVMDTSTLDLGQQDRRRSSSRHREPAILTPRPTDQQPLPPPLSRTRRRALSHCRTSATADHSDAPARTECQRAWAPAK